MQHCLNVKLLFRSIGKLEVSRIICESFIHFTNFNFEEGKQENTEEDGLHLKSSNFKTTPEKLLVSANVTVVGAKE